MRRLTRLSPTIKKIVLGVSIVSVTGLAYNYALKPSKAVIEPIV